VGLGIWRGRTIEVWRDAGGTWWRQGSARTLVLWGALIVARAVLYGLDAAAGHREVSGLGMKLPSCAASARTHPPSARSWREGCTLARSDE